MGLEVLYRLAELLGLKFNWDSYGGLAIEADTVATALYEIIRLAAVPWSTIDVWPMPDGGLTIEYGDEGREISVY